MTTSFKPCFTFYLAVDTETSIQQLNRLWNLMAEVAQEQGFVQTVDLTGGVDLDPIDDTDAIDLERAEEDGY